MINMIDLEKANTLFVIQEIETSTGKINSMFDSCSDCNLILNTYAQKNGMLGYPINVTIDTINGKENVETNYYHVVLYDQSKQKEHVIIAFGVPHISSPLPKINMSQVKNHFPQHVQDVWDKVSDRPTGEVQLLIGQCQAGIHPTDHSISDNLKIQKSIFGNGYVLTGSSPLIRTKKVVWSSMQS